jgi:hypothetical protein
MSIKLLIQQNRKQLSTFLSILCVVIILFAFSGFNENKKHDGLPNLLISSASYVTTTLACVIALLFLLN